MNSSPATRPTAVRYLVVGVTSLMSVLLYLDRFCVSFAEGFIQADLGLTDVQSGWMLSAFFWTYALAQVPTGWLTDRWGARIMLTTYILGWSLFTGLSGLAGSFAALLLLRFGFGLMQAGAYPTGASIVSRWAPFSQRGMASSAVTSGGRLGGWLALYLTGFVIVWLTPASTPTELQVADLLQPANIATALQQELAPGSDRPNSPNRLLALSLTEPEKAAVLRLAAPSAASNSAASNSAASNSAAGAQNRLTSAVEASEQVPAETVEQSTVAPPSSQEADRSVADDSQGVNADSLANSKSANQAAEPGADTKLLAEALNRAIKTPTFFASADFAGLQLEREARRLAAQDPTTRSADQSQRMNRLIMETVFGKGLRKYYGAGWRPMMMFYAAIGLVIGGLVFVVCRNHPSQHPLCNAAEVELIGSDPRMAVKSPKSSLPIRAILTNRSMWLCCACQWFTNVGWVFVLTWAPRYFTEVHNVPIEERALMVSIPPLIGWAGMLIGGTLTDRMVSWMGLRWGRAFPMSASRFLAMGAYLVCLFEPSPWVAVAMFSLVSFATDLGTPPIWAYNQDVGGRHVASILGWGNMWGNLGAAVATPLVIWIVGEGQNWGSAFGTCAAAFFLAGIASAGINATLPLVPEEPSETA